MTAELWLVKPCKKHEFCHPYCDEDAGVRLDPDKTVVTAHDNNPDFSYTIGMCRTHGDPMRRYDDGWEACWYDDAVVGTRSDDHEFIPILRFIIDALDREEVEDDR